MIDRPHCSAPQDCSAKGNGHCRRCAGLAAMGRLRSDPGFGERLADKARHATPAARAAWSKTMHRLNKLKRFCKKRDAKARLMMAALSADPATVDKACISRVKRFARLKHIPVDVVPEYRELRAKHLDDDEVVAVLARSYPSLFEAFHTREALKQRRPVDRASASVGSVTATLMGDPPAGRSALAQRQASGVRE